MAFTTWAALRTELLDLLQSHITSGDAITGTIAYSGQSGSRQLTYRSVDDIEKLIDLTYRMERVESPPSVRTRKSFGKFRNY